MSKCSVDNCKRSARYKGLCGMHYKRAWRHGDPNITLIDMNRQPFNCNIPGCENQGRYPSTMLCHVHHIRITRYGRTDRIKAIYGTGTTNSAGYRVLTVDGKRVYEHVWLAEKALGKPLPEKAVVHHMNEQPADNYTPFNLVICPDQAYHLLLHRRAIELGYSKQNVEQSSDLSASELGL